MIKISYWAKNHVWQARILIILIYLLLNAIGIFTGKLLQEVGVIIPQSYFTACIILTIILWVGYPGKNLSKSVIKPRVLYVRRKIFDFSLGAVTFLMIVFAGNNWEKLFFKSEMAQASKSIRIRGDSATYMHPLLQNFITSIQGMDVSKLTEKEKIKIIKKQIRKINNDTETSKGNKTLLIILSVLVAIGLLIGLGALSCSISCGGAEALAILVAVTGTFLVIFFLVKIIKKITNAPPKKAAVKIVEK